MVSGRSYYLKLESLEILGKFKTLKDCINLDLTKLILHNKLDQTLYLRSEWTSVNTWFLLEICQTR